MISYIRLICLSACVALINSDSPAYYGVKGLPPPRPVLVALPSAPAVEAIKTPPLPPPRILAPAPPVRARVGVKTVVRPAPPPVAQIVEQEVVAPLGLAEPFSYNYDVKDEFGNNQYRRESGDTNGVVRGSYGYTDANGLYRIVDYIADQDGFRANIRSNEPGLVDAPANPADITLAAEQPPLKVREAIRAIPPYGGKLRKARNVL